MCCAGSLSKLKIVRSVHYCPATGKFLERKYTDLTSAEGFPTSSVYPTKVRNVKMFSFLMKLSIN